MCEELRTGEGVRGARERCRHEATPGDGHRVHRQVGVLAWWYRRERPVLYVVPVGIIRHPTPLGWRHVVVVVVHLHVGDRYGVFGCSRHAQTGVKGGAVVVGKVAG